MPRGGRGDASPTSKVVKTLLPILFSSEELLLEIQRHDTKTLFSAHFQVKTFSFLKIKSKPCSHPSPPGSSGSPLGMPHRNSNISWKWDWPRQQPLELGWATKSVRLYSPRKSNTCGLLHDITALLQWRHATNTRARFLHPKVTYFFESFAFACIILLISAKLFR